MKKNIFNFLIIVLLCGLFSSCDVINSLWYGNEIFIKNCTTKSIVVTIKEDPETNASKKYGAYTFTKRIGSGNEINTKAVMNDYYKIIINGETINPQYEAENGKIEYGNSEYYLITGTDIVLEIYENENFFYYVEKYKF